MQSTVAQLSPWKRYKRRADNVTVRARLVMVTDQLQGEKKMLEVSENRMEDFPCPNCKYLITQGNSQAFPNFFLEPPIFLEAHKPLDIDL